MSKFTFDGVTGAASGGDSGGGGELIVPVNSFTWFDQRLTPKYEDAEGRVYLRTSFVDTDVASYPEAIQRFVSLDRAAVREIDVSANTTTPKGCVVIGSTLYTVDGTRVIDSFDIATGNPIAAKSISGILGSVDSGSIALSASDNLVIGDRSVNGIIKEISPTGTLINTFDITSVIGAVDVAGVTRDDVNDKYYVIDEFETVYEFNNNFTIGQEIVEDATTNYDSIVAVNESLYFIDFAQNLRECYTRASGSNITTLFMSFGANTSGAGGGFFDSVNNKMYIVNDTTDSVFEVPMEAVVGYPAYLNTSDTIFAMLPYYVRVK